MERNAINYSRNLLAYGVRAAMYSELHAVHVHSAAMHYLQCCFLSWYGRHVGDHLGQPRTDVGESGEFPLAIPFSSYFVMS